MNFLHLLSYDYGGAARCALHLHRRVAEYGHHSEVLVYEKTLTSHDIIEFKYGRWQKLQKRALESILVRTPALNRADPNYRFMVELNYGRISARQLLRSVTEKPDIIVAHWTSGFVNSRVLADLSLLAEAPVAWVLADMAPFTGGCHYAFGCEGYKRSCGHCPAITSRHREDWSHWNWKTKRKSYQRMRSVFVTSSDRQNLQARQSSLLKDRPILRIHPAMWVDGKIYCKDIDRGEARQRLNIARDSKVIFFGCHNLNDERKGAGLFSEAMICLYKDERLQGSLRDRILILMAGGGEGELLRQIPFSYRHTGYMTDKNLSEVYAISDVFVSSTIEDSGPLMVLESLMCGTPVVAFDIGYAAMFVKDGESGFIAGQRNPESLAERIFELLSMDDLSYEAMRSRCGHIVTEEFHPEREVQKIVDAAIQAG